VCGCGLIEVVYVCVCVRVYAWVADLCVNVVVAIRPPVEHGHLRTESSARVNNNNNKTTTYIAP